MSSTQTLVVLDFETTSLDVATGAVIEIAACRHAVEGGALARPAVETMQTLVKPRVPIEPESEAIHGISNAQAGEEGQDPAAAFEALRDFMGDATLVAHNGVFFDYLYLANELSRYGLSGKDNLLLDTLPLARAHLKSDHGYGLATLCEAYDIVNEQAHRALSDVSATAELFEHILKREADFDKLWAESYGYTLRTLSEAPEGLALLQRAIDEHRELCIEYAGSGKPQRKRWIRPLSFAVTRGGNRSVRAICLESDSQKQFRLDRIVRLIELR